tara:strand:+ start:10689 stop:11675 length:987 start_codon:yes stop_codon:yes gene_type:complete
MRYYESKKGYFYKQYKNGKKVRISRKNFIKKQIGKKQIGNGRSISDFIINERKSNFTINGRKIILVSVSHDEALDEKEIHKLFKDFNGDANTYFLLEEDTRFTPTQLFEHYNATDNNRMTEETSRAIIGKMIQTYSPNNPKLKRVEGWDIRPTLYNTKIRDWLYGTKTVDKKKVSNYMTESYNVMKQNIKLSKTHCKTHCNTNDYSNFFNIFNHNTDLREYSFTSLLKYKKVTEYEEKIIHETAKSLQEFYKNEADQYVLDEFIYKLSDTKNYIIIVGKKHYENLIKKIKKKILNDEFFNVLTEMENNTKTVYNNNNNNTEMDYNNEN